MTTLYAGLRASKDGGAGGLFRHDERGWERTLDQDTQAITVDPRDPNVVFAGTSAGPYRSTDAGRSWRRAGFPEDGAQVWSIAFDPSDPRTVYAGGSPVAVYRSDDGGETFRRMPDIKMPERVRMSFACRVMRIAPSPQARGELFAALEVGGAMHSSDGGETWEDRAEDLARMAALPHLKSRIVSNSEAEGMLDGHAIATTPAAPGRAFLAVRMGLFSSDDAGRTWQNLEVGKFSPHTYGRDIRVSPHDPRVMFACLSPAFTSGTGSLWRSDDAGRSWARFDKAKPGNTAMGLAIHPADPRQVYFTAKTGAVFGTSDGGENWTEIALPERAGEAYALACA
jgi:photosystem II stability/assembly factor-like uncharacterized protein